MENSHLLAPYHGSSDINIPGSDQFFLNDESPSLGLQEFPSIVEPSLCNWLLPDQPAGFGVDNLISNDPQADDFVSDMITEPIGNVVGNCEGGSGDNGESVGLENVNACQIFPESSGFGSPAQDPECPDLPSPYILLREIFHTNGKQVRNLEIYGLVGIISHAIVYKVDPDIPSENVEYQTFKFSGESLSNVKNFLVQYWEDRKQEGYWMIQDPFLHFYQALCVGIHENDKHASNNVLRPSTGPDADCNGVRLTGSGNGHTAMNQHEADRNGAGPSKISLSKQRERTGKLKLKDFSKYFDLRITDVAKKFKVCPSVVKKKCREGGLKKWPYRKIKGIKRKIKQKKESLTACADEERPQTLLEIQMLERQLQDIFIKLGELQM